MSEKKNAGTAQKRFLYRDRLNQVPIYLGKQLRGFLYQNDWKVLPMSAIIATLIAMVIKGGYFSNTEGTLRGSFALTFVAIWNGCFNSIQVICRERNILKRDHRSGLHITSYVAAHMIYQALLCLAQTALTMVICYRCGVEFPKTGGAVLNPVIFEIGITFFLASYAADMLSLLISSLVHSTTAAMTVMPFILIFQLVFSGGFFALPGWGLRLADFTVSKPTLYCMNAQADFNSLGSAMVWNSVASMRKERVEGTVTLGEVLDLLQGKKGSIADGIRKKEIRQKDVIALAAGMAEDPVLREMILAEAASMPEDEVTTCGAVIDEIAASEYANANRGEEIPFSFTVKQLMDVFGEEKVRDTLMDKTSASAHSPDYEHDKDVIKHYWGRLVLQIFAYAALATVALEFVDRDKR